MYVYSREALIFNKFGRSSKILGSSPVIRLLETMLNKRHSMLNPWALESKGCGNDRGKRGMRGKQSKGAAKARHSTWKVAKSRG